MSERIWDALRNALYKSTYTLKVGISANYWLLPIRCVWRHAVFCRVRHVCSACGLHSRFHELAENQTDSADASETGYEERPTKQYEHDCNGEYIELPAAAAVPASSFDGAPFHREQQPFLLPTSPEDIFEGTVNLPATCTAKNENNYLFIYLLSCIK